MKPSIAAAFCTLFALTLYAPFLIGGSPSDGSSPPPAGGWSLAPVVGYLSGGLTPGTPESDIMIYGVKVSHRKTGTAWVDLAVTKFKGTRDFYLVNGRANYPLLDRRFLTPYASAGAGFIATGSDGRFDFLIGAGLFFELMDRISLEQAYTIHYSPSQIFTDAEGNPVNSLETSVHIWF
jgi:hypothetical protein